MGTIDSAETHEIVPLDDGWQEIILAVEQAANKYQGIVSVQNWLAQGMLDSFAHEAASEKSILKNE